MKKTLVSALTGALVIGATATTFAAANPFEDVPADHWAYDAVAQLAADGVIEGYGDGTYRGDQEITRYEMAQMVARAMAKSGVNGADKAMIDRLAAEFADELNNLGVRAAALEKKVDNVKWTGRVRYRYIHRSEEKMSDHEKENQNTNQVLLRLEPTARINENWVGKARIDYGKGDNMNTAANETSATVDRIYVEGTYGTTKIDLGKIPFKTQADYGMVSDYRMAGGQVVFGKDVKLSLAAGRINDDSVKVFNYNASNAASQTAGLSNYAASYQGVEVYNDRAQQFTWGVGFQRVKQDEGWVTGMLGRGHTLQSPNGPVNIWNVGLGYKFNKDVNLTGAYARATGVDAVAGQSVDSKYKYSYAVQLNYKGAKASEMGSWGAFVGYRHLGVLSTIHSTYREFGPMNGGEKGWEVGLNWAPMKNVVGKVQYYWGKELISENKVNALWTELSFIF